MATLQVFCICVIVLIAKVCCIQETFTSLVLIARVCEEKEPVNVETFKKFWFGEFRERLSYCSLDNVLMNNIDDTSNAVVSVNIPCGFESDIIDDWMYYTLNEAAKNGINVNLYKYKILILPASLSRSWAGLGVVDCNNGPHCFSWIRSEFLSTFIYLHELGHNWGLGHATLFGNNEGDLYSIMGRESSNNCYNGAHRTFLQWDTPSNKVEITASTSINLDINNTKRDPYILVKLNQQSIFVDFTKTMWIVYKYNSSEVSTTTKCVMTKARKVCILREDALVFKIISYNDTLININISYNTTDGITNSNSSKQLVFKDTILEWFVLLLTVFFVFGIYTI